MNSVDRSYDIYKHVHRFAAWAASRAAFRGIRGFGGETGRVIIEAAGLPELIGGPHCLPDPNVMDRTHRDWRKKVRNASKKCGHELSHGRAAKLINVYLKSALVTTAYYADPRVCALHPPVDRELLGGLVRAGKGDMRFWRSMRDIGWTSFDSVQYESVIHEIRTLQVAEPLWAIEEWWTPGNHG